MSQDMLHIRNADEFACYSLGVANSSTVCAKYPVQHELSRRTTLHGIHSTQALQKLPMSM